jgi:lysozyme
MGMKLSKAGLDFLKREEGVVKKVYKDQAGLPTAGVGHLLSKEEMKSLGLKMGDPVSDEQVNAWLSQDVARFEEAVGWPTGAGFPPYRFDSLVSCAFNIGEAAYKQFIKPHADRGNYTEAARHMRMFNKATLNGVKQVLPVLEARRRRETKLLLMGVYK